MSTMVYNVIDAQYVPGIISGNNVIMFMQRNNFSQLRLGDEIKGVLIITQSQAHRPLSHPEHRVGGLNYFFLFPIDQFSMCY